MRDIKTLLERCQALGAILTPINDRLKVKAPQPLPDDLMAELKLAKTEILAELQQPSLNRSSNWLLEEWRRISLPEWRRILKESIEKHNASREEYARYMLKEVLEDHEYKEER